VLLVKLLGLPWLDDEQGSLQLGTTRVFTMMDGRARDIHAEDRCHECMLMSSCKVHKLVLKTRRGKGHNADFYVINITLAAKQPTEFQNGEEFTSKQRENLWSLIYDNFP
jgi:hypothetical protein